MSIVNKFTLKRTFIGLTILMLSLVIWESQRRKKVVNMINLAKANGASVMLSKPTWVENLPVSLAMYYPESVESVSFNEDVSEVLLHVMSNNLKSSSIIKKWNKAEIDNQINSEKPLLVHVYANWAVPINLIVIMKTGSFLKSRNINVYTADNTKHNSEISDYIKKHNRLGVPLTVFYWKGKAHKLPETYSKEYLQNFIKKIINK